MSFLDDNGTPANKTDDTWTTYKTADGLGHDDVSAVAVDSGRKIWIGTTGELCLLEDNGSPADKGDDVWPSLDTYGAPYGISKIVIDSTGGKWFASSSGVSYCR